MDKNREVLVVKQVTFDACHRLVNYDGKCNRLHGHTYKLEVGVKGIRDDRGLVIDFGTLKKMISNCLLDDGPVLDHNNLNETMPFIDMCYENEMENTTCENMVDSIFQELAPRISTATQFRAHLQFIKLWETPTSYAIITKEDFEQGGH